MPDSVPLTRLFSSPAVALAVKSSTVALLRSPKSFLQELTRSTRAIAGHPKLIYFFIIISFPGLKIECEMEIGAFAGRVREYVDAGGEAGAEVGHFGIVGLVLRCRPEIVGRYADPDPLDIAD